MKTGIKKLISAGLLGISVLICVSSHAKSTQNPVLPVMPSVVVTDNTLVQTTLGIIPVSKISEKDLPANLLPWLNWIKAKNIEDQCLLSNANEKQCVFAPSVEIGENNLSFEFKITGTSYLPEFWIKIPSGQSQKVWPENILVNNQKGQVLEKDGFALVKVPKGEFNVVFNIDKQELINSPSLLLAQNFLIIKNKTTSSWVAENNQLLLITKKLEVKEDTFLVSKNEEIKVYRKLTDGIPLRLETRVKITYSGKEKELFLGKVLPDNFRLLQIQSDLSINQRDDGFYVKVTSGEHLINFNSYSFDNSKIITVKDLVRSSTGEFWSFQNNANIRQVEIKSATIVDPKQAFVPQEWESFIAYNVKESLSIETIRRGINIQETLSYRNNRHSWYGFNNDTMLHVDTMRFDNEGKPFMSFDSSIVPKEFSFNNQPQMIVENDKKQGIVLKQGKYPASLHAQSTLDFTSKFIADSKQQLDGWVLTVAPRHRLIYATGVDRAVNSWADNWNLYTVFAIFLITLGFYKLFGLPLAALSFSSILLFQSSPLLAWTIWPMLLLLMALLKVLPDKNNFTKLIRTVTAVLVLSVSFIFITFTVQESRYIVNGSLEQIESSPINYASNTLGRVASMPGQIAMEKGMSMPQNASMVDSSESSDSPESDKQNSIRKSIPVSQEQFEKETKSIETQRVQVTTGQPTWYGINYTIMPSSLMEDRVGFYIAKPWAVNIASIIQILNLLILWVFLVMYTLNIYKKFNVLILFPQKLRENKLLKPFLGAQK